MSETQINEPYKPHQIIKVEEIPENITRPETDEEIVESAKYIFHQTTDSTNLLPEKYAELEVWFKSIYKTNYDEGSWIDIAPRNLDYLYQQFGIKTDERTNKNGFNTFGLYALSYLDGLRTMGVQQGYLGAGGWEHRVKDKYRGLLLGCSSITTASQFFSFMDSINPKNDAIVTDIDPLAVKLSREAIKKSKTQQVIQSDVQRIPLEDKSVDFIATNFLVPNLIDVEKSGVDTLTNVFKEIKRVLDPKGRLIMVEQLLRINLEWLNHYAWEQGLILSTGGPDGGINRPAYIFKNHRWANNVITDLESFIKESSERNSRSNVTQFTMDPQKEFDGQPQDYVTNLIFQHSR
ncbi:MAG: methyltransferase domain-containing protein [Patescibacteria group bacterium]